MTKFYAATSFFVLLISQTVNAQYCTSVGPSSTADSNLASFYLAGESATAINFTGCPGVMGLDDQTFSQTVVLNAGSFYNALAGFGTCGGSFPGVGEAWIDYNQNQVFEPSESIGTWTGTPPAAAANWNFGVPGGAMAGTTRMRVVHYEGGVLPIDPCAVFSWGSTTDFTVQIGGGLDCSAYIGESLTDPRIISSLPFSENHDNSICYSNVLTVYSSPDVFYRILPNVLGIDQLTVSLCGSTLDSYLSILDADGNILWYNDDFSSCGTSSQITFSCAALDTVYFAVQGWGNSAGAYSILVDGEFVSVNESEIVKPSFFPNPATTTITMNAIQNGMLELYDLSGKLVFSSSFQPSECIDISSLSPGTYIVKTLNDLGELNQKLIIE